MEEKMKEKILLLIDGNSIINRAYFALPEMDNGEGLKTNAIYGFLTMMFRMINDYKPTHISVAFDVKSPTFRHKEYKEYKAGRKKMDPELGMQFEPLKRLLDKMSIDREELAGYEADDILGTISKRAENEGFKVYIVSGDRDAIQLASDNTTVLITKKGISEIEEYDTEGVIERYGLTPTQFIDLKGLMGDKSDNIPGVSGIGEKTGIKLLKEYHTVEGVIENASSLTPKQREKFELEAENAIMSKELATIFRDVPIEYNMDDLKFEIKDRSSCLEEMAMLKFNSLIGRFNSLCGEEIEEKTIETKRLSDENIGSFIEEVNKSKSMFIKIFEGDGNILNKKISKVYLSSTENELFYLDGCDIELIRGIIEDEGIKKCGFEMKDDYVALKPYGINLNNIWFDISIAEYLIDSKTSTSYDIEVISNKYLYKKAMSKEELLGKGKSMMSYDDVDIEKLNEYALGVMKTVYGCLDKMMEKIVEDGMDKLFYDVEMPLIEVLGDMEYVGIYADKNILKSLGDKLDEIIDSETKEIYELAGEEFNINSPKQLGVILFEKLGLPVIKKTKTGYSTNAEVLDALSESHPIIDKIGNYRSMVKLKSTYIDGISSVINEIDGRVHSSFNQTVATTGRISSTEPNMQNIPVRTDIGREIRKIFVSEGDMEFIDADYSQVELRVLAHMSGDENMIEAFESGEDIHRKTASQVFGVSMDEVSQELRSAAKAVNFGIIYGKSDFGLAKDLGISQEKAKNYISSYFAKYGSIKKFMDEIISDAEETGYAKTMFNRRRYIPEIKSKKMMEKNRGKRAVMNAPIQGSAADIIKIAMVNVHKRLKNEGLKSRLILQVHDELIIEAYPDELDVVQALLRTEMENAVDLRVNLDVDLNIGKSWYETK